MTCTAIARRHAQSSGLTLGPVNMTQADGDPTASQADRANTLQAADTVLAIYILKFVSAPHLGTC